MLNRSVSSRAKLDVLRTKEVRLAPREIKSVLTSLLTLHTQVDDAATTDGQNINAYERPRKRPKHTPSIQSAIEYTERLVRTRYRDIDQMQNGDELILYQEERCRFGIDDVLFREEEDIICLAFELSVQAIENESMDVSKHPAGRNTYIDTALRIVDVVQMYDRNERRLRSRRRNCPARSAAKSRPSKQQKYMSLLRPKDNGKSDEVDTTPKSVIEERFADKWKWLQNFRTSYDSRVKSDHASNDASNRKSGGRNGDIEFLVHRPELISLDDLSISSSEEEQDEIGLRVQPNSQQSLKTSDGDFDRVAESPLPQVSETAASCQGLDAQAFQLRMNLLGMPPSERKSIQVTRHTVTEIGSLLAAYGDADGAGGIARLGDVLSGLRPPDGVASVSTPSFPLEETVVALLVRDHLTDAMGALRARAFLRAFVLPLMIEISPAAKAVYYGCSPSGGKEKGKPASRSMTSFLAGLCRDRPNEFVLGVLAPSLTVQESASTVNNAELSSFEPSRFQCELVVRLLKGKDGLSLSATALLLNGVLPSSDGTSGMKWTEASMPIVTVCVNRKPVLTSASLAKLLDRVIACLSPGSPPSMTRSMKLSTLFNSIVTKYSSQVKESGKVDQLKNSASRLKTFNSKTLIAALKKL